MVKKTCHSNSKVASSHTKIEENLADFIFKTKDNNKSFLVLKNTCLGLQKSKSESLRHVNSILKIYFFHVILYLCECIILKITLWRYTTWVELFWDKEQINYSKINRVNLTEKKFKPPFCWTVTLLYGYMHDKT